MKKHISEKFVKGEKCIYPIGGGKGGTGKSFIAASLGTTLAKQGKKILLVDLDLGASNLHTFLGLRKPRISLKQYLNKEVNDLNDVVLKTTQSNLSIISSSGCSLEIANLYYAQKLKIIRAINNLSYDYIFIDLGSGTHFNTLDFFLMSDQAILVTTPEPVSIENMFRFIKSLYLRKIKSVLKDYNLNVICREYLNNIQDSQIVSFSNITDFVKKYDLENDTEIQKYIKHQNIGLVLNRFRWQVERQFIDKIANTCNKLLYFNYYPLGNISFDHKIDHAMMNSKVFVDEYSHTISAKEIFNISTQIINRAPAQVHSERLVS
ncbi:MAG: AAA family ATPase [Syntrophobacteria bacterium]